MKPEEDKEEKNICACNKIAPALEHDLTCPVRSAFLMFRYKDYVEKELENSFKDFGYNPSVSVPNKDFSEDYEMMKCKSCGHWFPRWQLYKCPECNEGH